MRWTKSHDEKDNTKGLAMLVIPSNRFRCNPSFHITEQRAAVFITREMAINARCHKVAIAKAGTFPDLETQMRFVRLYQFAFEHVRLIDLADLAEAAIRGDEPPRPPAETAPRTPITAPPASPDLPAAERSPYAPRAPPEGCETYAGAKGGLL
jgi:hypothetical protein